MLLKVFLFSMCFLVEVIRDYSSVNYFCVQKCDEHPRASVCLCVCVYVHQEAFCPQQMLKPWEVGRRGAVRVFVCACVCVCVCVLVLRQLAEEVGHVLDHTGH